MASEIGFGLHNSRLEPAPVKLSPEDRVARGKAARKAVPGTDQNERDHDTLAVAVKSGRLTAEIGV
jgi:hypothetical protein